MNTRHLATRYGSLSIGLHWVTLLLLAGVYACIELHEAFPKGSDTRDALKTWHFMLGLVVLGVTLLRLVVSAVATTPAIDPDLPLWQRRGSRAMHIALYVLLLGMPLAGWLLLSAAGKAVPLFGLTLPPLVAENRAVADVVKELHEAGGTIGYFLIGLHAAAALFHHYVVGDDTLRRMLPRRA